MLLALAALMPGVERARAAPADSAVVEASETEADTGAIERPAARDTTRRRSPKPVWVMLRSLVVPGWGQATNRAWLKAAAIAAGEGYLIARVIDDQGALDDLARNVQAAREEDDIDLEELAVAAYNDRLNQSLTRQWLLGGLVVYAMVDAYVDAHFRGFKTEFGRDPALPRGGGPLEVRVRWEWTF